MRNLRFKTSASGNRRNNALTALPTLTGLSATTHFTPYRPVVTGSPVVLRTFATAPTTHEQLKKKLHDTEFTYNLPGHRTIIGPMLKKDVGEVPDPSHPSDNYRDNGARPYVEREESPMLVRPPRKDYLVADDLDLYWTDSVNREWTLDIDAPHIGLALALKIAGFVWFCLIIIVFLLGALAPPRLHAIPYVRDDSMDMHFPRGEYRKAHKILMMRKYVLQSLRDEITGTPVSRSVNLVFYQPAKYMYKKILSKISFYWNGIFSMFTRQQQQH